jgi:hypothetical protein
VLRSAVVYVPVREPVTSCCARAAGVTTAMRSACESREGCTAQQDKCTKTDRGEFSHHGVPLHSANCPGGNWTVFSAVVNHEGDLVGR